MSIVVGIPTIGVAAHLDPLLKVLLADDEIDEILLMVNRPDVTLFPPEDPRVRRIDLVGVSIYVEWNLAISHAASKGAAVALLNDDITIGPGAISSAVAMLRADPKLVAVGLDYRLTPLSEPQMRYVHGSFRHGGVGGFAFVADAARCPLVDESFEWWGGDDDLFMTIEKAGHRLGIAEGIHVRHIAETTAHHYPELAEAAGRDRERMLAKWGEAW